MTELLEPEEGGEPVYLNIVLMREEDYFSSMNSLTNMVYQTLKELTAEYDNIELIAYNTTVHPELAEKYEMTSLDRVQLSDVVIELADENHNALGNVPAKKYSVESFFTADSSSGSYIGYNAEARLLSAVAQLTGQSEKPVAYYLQGHGEPTLEEASDWQGGFGSLPALKFKRSTLLRRIFLFPRMETAVITLSSSTVRNMTFCQHRKFQSKKNPNLLGTNYGNMIVVEDSSSPRLPALEGLLSEWGLGYGGSVTDDQHSVSLIRHGESHCRLRPDL